MRISQLVQVAFLTSFVLVATPAVAAQLAANCTARDETGGERIVCQVRSVSGENPTDIKAVDGDGRQLEFTSAPYSWTDHRTAIYFVVQTSDLSADQLRRVGAFLERAAFPVGRRIIGLGTFDHSFYERAALGSYRLQISRIVQEIADSSPSKAYPEITDHLRDPLEKLARKEAERKALVLVSDGASAANAGTERELADLAKANNIAIYNLILSKTDRPQSAVLTRIAEKTLGATRDLAGSPNADVIKLGSDLFPLIENGSVLSLDARGLPKEAEITVKASIEGDRQISADPVIVTRLTEDSLDERAMDMVSRNMFAILALLGLAVGLAMILGSVVLPRWRARKQAEAAAAAATSDIDSVPGEMADAGSPTEIVMKSWAGPAGSPPLGWLQLVGGDGQQMPLYVGSTRVGRHRENEVCLLNNSVHRRHAILHVSQDGTFSIHDLGTKNGVAVNGTRINQHNLADGDVIELGEVKLRFMSNDDAIVARPAS
jgi:hypothetical protein